MRKVRAILLFGPPGCGKGTQSKKLVEKRGYIHVSSGDLFRALDPQSSLGQLVAKYIQSGDLMPDDVVMQVFEAHIDHLIASGSYNPDQQVLLLDGIPRTLFQAKELQNKVEVISVLVFVIKDQEVLFERVAKRAEIEGRQDDQNKEVLQKRLEIYHQQMDPILTALPSDLQIHIDAQVSADEVFKEIIEKTAQI